MLHINGNGYFTKLEMLMTIVTSISSKILSFLSFGTIGQSEYVIRTWNLTIISMELFSFVACLTNWLTQLVVLNHYSLTLTPSTSYFLQFSWTTFSLLCTAFLFFVRCSNILQMNHIYNSGFIHKRRNG